MAESSRQIRFSPLVRVGLRCFVAVFVVDNGGLFVFLVIQVQDIAIVCRDLHDVHREQDAAYAGRHDADAKQAADRAEECRHRVALTLRFLFCLGTGCPVAPAVDFTPSVEMWRGCLGSMGTASLITE